MMQSTPAQSALTTDVLPAAIARVRRRVVPYMMLLYIVSFLDRANISFAKQALQASVGISERTYALAAGLFFVSYSLCGFPSNLILHRIGAKLWLSFLMVGWGLASMATMFVAGSTSFYPCAFCSASSRLASFPAPSCISPTGFPIVYAAKSWASSISVSLSRSSWAGRSRACCSTCIHSVAFKAGRTCFSSKDRSQSCSVSARSGI